MPDRDPVDIVAFNVRRLRGERGWTQEHAGLESGVSFSTWAKTERRERETGIRTLGKMAAGLGVPLAELFREGPVD